jgi:hypothetical protein
VVAEVRLFAEIADHGHDQLTAPAAERANSGRLAPDEEIPLLAS